MLRQCSQVCLSMRQGSKQLANYAPSAYCTRPALPPHWSSADSLLRLWSLQGAMAEGAALPTDAAGPADGGAAARMGRSSSGGAGAHGTACCVEAVRTYSGHTNERNFVGLSNTGNYIATGSETGEVRAGGWEQGPIIPR